MFERGTMEARFGSGLTLSLGASRAGRPRGAMERRTSRPDAACRSLRYRTRLAERRSRSGSLSPALPPAGCRRAGQTEISVCAVMAAPVGPKIKPLRMACAGPLGRVLRLCGLSEISSWTRSQRDCSMIASCSPGYSVPLCMAFPTYTRLFRTR
jgi:hypothetical protein